MRVETTEMVTKDIRRLTPVLGRHNVERLEKAYLLGEEETRKRIIETVDSMKAAVFSDDDLRNTILLEPPSKGISKDGDVELGKVLYGRKELYPLRLQKEIFLTHMGIFGSSGYGKTNAAFHLIRELSDQGIPVIVFDFAKRNYKDLLNTELKDKVKVYTVGRDVSPFKFNPLVPPEGVLKSQWVKEFSEIFDHAYWMMGGGRHVILKALEDVYSYKEKPTLKDLKMWLDDYTKKKMSGRERNWVATAKRPFESLCFAETGSVFAVDKGVTPDRFFEPGQITVLELDALSTNDKTFLIEIVLQWMRDWLLVNDSRDQLKGVVFLEEAHHVLNREKASKTGSESVIDLIFREIRELGVGLVYMDQHPSLISYPALGNTSTHVYMNLGLDTKQSSDVSDSIHMLGLDYREESEYLRQLPIGQAFFVSRICEFPRPFLVKFPKMDVKRGSVNDQDLEKQSDGQEYIEEVKEAERGLKLPELDDLEWRVLKEIGETEKKSSEIYKSLHISGTKFKQASEGLMDKGLVNRKETKIRGQKTYLHSLSPEALKLVKIAKTKGF